MRNKLTLSLIVPTYNRSELFEWFLSALIDSGESAGCDFEIIIVDDGSETDHMETISHAIEKRADSRLVFLKNHHKGPAAARNTAIKKARGEVLLFLGDDIISTKNLFDIHVDFHSKFPEPQKTLLGKITWHPDLDVTPFMKWLENGGPQFRYNELTSFQQVPYTYFYSSNISLKRAFLLENGLFDETFPYAAYEDTELAFRLDHHGMEIFYDSNALAFHWHPTSLDQALSRMAKVGRSAILFESKTGLNIGGYSLVHPIRENLGNLKFKAAYALGRMLEKKGFPPALMAYIMDRARRKGYLEALAR